MLEKDNQIPGEPPPPMMFTSRVRAFSKSMSGGKRAESNTSPGPGPTIELPARSSSISRGTPLCWLLRE